MATGISKSASKFLTALYVIMVLGSVFTVDAQTTPDCIQVVSVNSGDTCFGIAEANNISLKFFNSINPNLNCSALFVSQWLCVSGIAN